MNDEPDGSTTTPQDAAGTDDVGSPVDTGTSHPDSSTSTTGGPDASTPSHDSGSVQDAGASGDGAQGQGCSGDALCDNFDNLTKGSLPSASLWTLLGTAGCSGSGNPSAPQIYPIVIDDMQFHSRPNSLKVTGGDSCGPLMINTSAMAQITGGEVYGRFYVHISDPTVLIHHAVLMALGLQGDSGAGLNVNDQSSFLEFAPEAQGGLPTSVFLWQTIDGNHLPNTDSVGAMSSTYLPATGFTCVEFHTSANTGAIQTWFDGTLIAGLSSPPAPPSANGTMWTPPTPFAPKSFALGWMSFSSQAMTAWFDDVALSGSRIGCL